MKQKFEDMFVKSQAYVELGEKTVELTEKAAEKHSGVDALMGDVEDLMNLLGSRCIDFRDVALRALDMSLPEALDVYRERIDEAKTSMMDEPFQ